MCLPDQAQVCVWPSFDVSASPGQVIFSGSMVALTLMHCLAMAAGHSLVVQAVCRRICFFASSYKVQKSLFL